MQVISRFLSPSAGKKESCWNIDWKLCERLYYQFHGDIHVSQISVFVAPTAIEMQKKRANPTYSESRDQTQACASIFGDAIRSQMFE